jgi:hypothetical protein
MRFKSILSSIIAGLVCCQIPLLAQVTGSITGTVRDSSDAVIPRAKVVVSNSEHGIHRETISNSSGD